MSVGRYVLFLCQMFIIHLCCFVCVRARVCVCVCVCVCVYMFVVVIVVYICIFQLN